MFVRAACAFLLCLSALAATRPPSVSAGAAGEMNYFIVVTGGELLEGTYPDAHTVFLTRALNPLGMRCAGSMIVDDRMADIKVVLRFASERAGLIIVTGGLGPTDNDITREAVSEFTGVPLKEEPDVVKELQRRYAGGSGELRANLRRQARVPASGTYLKNPHGTAVGLVFEQEKLVTVALPGPPRELQPMVEKELLPYLNRRFGIRPPGCSLTLRFIGLGQSQIDQTLKAHAPPPPDAVLYSTFDADRVDFRFSLPDDTPENRRRLEEFRRKVEACLGEHLYSCDGSSLEQCVIRLLKGRGSSLALAEVGSGGALAAALNGVEGAGSVFQGAHIAPTEEIMRRMLRVPDDRWGAAATAEERVNLLADSDPPSNCWVVVAGEIRAGDGRGSWVPVSFRPPEGPAAAARAPFRDRSRLVTYLLDELRRRLR